MSAALYAGSIATFPRGSNWKPSPMRILRSCGYPGCEAADGEQGSAAGLYALLVPHAHLLGVYADSLGEAAPAEAAGLLETFDALTASTPQPRAIVSRPHGAGTAMRRTASTRRMICWSPRTGWTLGRGTRAHSAPSHISKTVLSTVHLGPPKRTRTIYWLTGKQTAPERSSSERDKMGQNDLCRRILATRYARPCRAPGSMIRSPGRRT